MAATEKNKKSAAVSDSKKIKSNQTQNRKENSPKFSAVHDQEESSSKVVNQKGESEADSGFALSKLPESVDCVRIIEAGSSFKSCEEICSNRSENDAENFTDPDFEQELHLFKSRLELAGACHD